MPGFLWGEIKQLWAEGLQAYLASVWNWIDIAMLNLYLASCTLNILSVTSASLAIDFFMTNVNAPCLYKNGNDPVANNYFYFLQRGEPFSFAFDPIKYIYNVYHFVHPLHYISFPLIVWFTEDRYVGKVPFQK